jgi:hypothetical protein
LPSRRKWKFLVSSVLVKLSFGLKVSVTAMERGSTSGSKCVTERDWRDERSRAESEGWMY